MLWKTFSIIVWQLILRLNAPSIRYHSMVHPLSWLHNGKTQFGEVFGQKTIHSGPQDSWWAGRGVWRRGGEYELLSWAGQWLVLMGSEINQQTLYRNQNPWWIKQYGWYYWYLFAVLLERSVRYCYVWPAYCVMVMCEAVYWPGPGSWRGFHCHCTLPVEAGGRGRQHSGTEEIKCFI